MKENSDNLKHRGNLSNCTIYEKKSVKTSRRELLEGDNDGKFWKVPSRLSALHRNSQRREEREMDNRYSKAGRMRTINLVFPASLSATQFFRGTCMLPACLNRIDTHGLIALRVFPLANGSSARSVRPWSRETGNTSWLTVDAIFLL